MNAPIKQKNITPGCQNCNLHSLCLPLGLDIGDIDKLNSIVKRNRPLHKGDYLFNGGDKFVSIYAIHSGSIKTFTESCKGDEQITGLYLPGELIGLDAIHGGIHPCSARALETTSLCELPFEILETLSHNVPELRHQLFRVMSKEIAGDQSLLMFLAQKNASERLAAFLINLSSRLKARNFSETQFNLTMSRKDIGNFLGLTIETISRTFSYFQNEGILTTDRKFVNIHKLDALKKLVG